MRMQPNGFSFHWWVGTYVLTLSLCDGFPEPQFAEEADLTLDHCHNVYLLAVT